MTQLYLLSNSQRYTPICQLTPAYAKFALIFIVRRFHVVSAAAILWVKELPTIHLLKPFPSNYTWNQLHPLAKSTYIRSGGSVFCHRWMRENINANLGLWLGSYRRFIHGLGSFFVYIFQELFYCFTATPPQLLSISYHYY